MANADLIENTALMTLRCYELAFSGFWLYLESKDKNRNKLEISKNLDDPTKMENMIDIPR